MEFKMKKRWWNVTTGNSNDWVDCDLGNWFGYVDEIALHLAGRAYGFDQELCPLIFAEVDGPPKSMKPSGDKVNISIDNKKFGTIFTPEKLLKSMRRYFKDRPVTIEKSNYYRTVLLRTNDKKSSRKFRTKRP